MLQTKLNGGLVAERAQPTDDGHGLVAEPALVAPLLARVHVADVHLDERDRHAQQRVPQRDRVVREGGGVDDDRVDALAARCVDPVDQRPLVVALEVRESVFAAWGGRVGRVGRGLGVREREVGDLRDGLGLDVGQCGGPVDGGLACPE